MPILGCANGFETLHLGGGLGSREDSLFQFKKSFNRTSSNVFSVGKKCFNKEVYEYLVSIRHNTFGLDLSSEFFPLYRVKTP